MIINPGPPPPGNGPNWIIRAVGEPAIDCEGLTSSHRSGILPCSWPQCALLIIDHRRTMTRTTFRVRAAAGVVIRTLTGFTGQRHLL